MKDSRLQEPIAIMETFNKNQYLIFDSKKLHMCDSDSNVIHENIDDKMRLFCGIKAVSCYCCSKDPTQQKRVFIADSTSAIYEFDYDWLLDKSDTNRTSGLNFRKFNANNSTLSTSTISLASTNSFNSNNQSYGTLSHGNNNTSSSYSLNSKGVYTALFYDDPSSRLLAARCDKQKTVIEVYNSDTHSYEYSIDSNNDKLKRITSICTTNDGYMICTDLIQNSVKMFRFN